jgi:plasmid stabilization system protein ParE
MEEGKGLQVVWTNHSKLRLQSIYEYIALDSVRAAEKLESEIQNLGNSLWRFPYAYPECPELPTKNHVYRKAVYDATYKIIYKIVKHEIWILDIFHGKRSPFELNKLRRVKP